ncbi:hypothetical protein D9M68_654220 [compost metagenome]
MIGEAAHQCALHFAGTGAVALGAQFVSASEELAGVHCLQARAELLLRADCFFALAQGLGLGNQLGLRSLAFCLHFRLCGIAPRLRFCFDGLAPALYQEGFERLFHRGDVSGMCLRKGIERRDDGAGLLQPQVAAAAIAVQLRPASGRISDRRIWRFPFGHAGLCVGATTSKKRVIHALGPVPRQVGNRRPGTLLARLQGLGSHDVSPIAFAIPVEDFRLASIGGAREKVGDDAETDPAAI